MVVVELKMLPGEAGAAIKFLRSKIPDGIKVDGNKIEIEDEKGRDVKLLLHKFLHHEGLDGYRVLSESGTLRVVSYDDSFPEDPPENDKIKGISPFPPLSTERLPLMDVVYPNYASDRLEPLRKLKKGKS
jgi:hypothetical protein